MRPRHDDAPGVADQNRPPRRRWSTAMIPHATYRPDGAVLFRVPYERGWVDRVKGMVPASARAWDKHAKVWTVAPPFGARVLDLTRRVFGHVAVAGAPEPPGRPEPIRRADPSYAALHLLPSAPACVVAAAYRALARDKHPDRLPAHRRAAAHERMVAINAAYEALRDRARA